MTKNYPQFSSCFKPGFFLVVFLFFGFSGLGQSLSKPTVSGTPGCSGEQINVSFEATKALFFGNFDQNTTYFIDLNNSGLNLFTTSFKSSKFTSFFGDFTISLNRNILLPPDLPPGNNYTIVVRSTDPFAESTSSEPFTFGVEPPTVTKIDPLCKGETLQLSAAAIPSATYTWTGPNNFNSDKQNPVIANATSVNAGDYSVTATVNGCTSEASTTNVVVNPNPIITGTNPGSRCGPGKVSLGATASAGTINWYTSPTGGSSLATGTTFTTPRISSNTTYYVVATSNGCTTGSRTPVVATVNTIPSITGTTPGSRCGSGTVDLGATASAGTLNWYRNPTGGPILGTGSTFTTPSISSNTTYYVDASSNGCTTGSRTAVLATVNTIPSAPTASNNGPICVDGKLGLMASDIPGATYQWNGPDGFTSSQQNPEISNMTASKAGTYSVTATVNGCTSEASITTVSVNINTPSTGDETTAGTDSWNGHVYDGTNFGTYLGTYTEQEEFAQGFGGNESCFTISSENGFNSLFTETFSVRYLNATSKTGLYVANLRSDDGIRLKINNETIHEYWTDRGARTDANVLLNLNKQENLLTYEFYENRGGNVVEFQNLRKVAGNQLSGEVDQVICDDGTAREITGDDIDLVTGVTQVGSGFQWVYSTSENGSKNEIPGATQKNFTPDLSVAPFNQPGEYFIYRRVSLQSANNKGLGASPYITTHESDAARILIAETPQVNFSASPTELCLGGEVILSGNFTGSGNYLISAEVNGTPVNNIPVDNNVFTLPYSINSTTNFTITSIEDIETGCVNNSPNASVTIIVKDEWEWTGDEDNNWNNTNNWSCNTLPTLETNVLIPESLASGNYPEITAGNNALAKDLTIENNASVEVTDNWLRIAGNLTNNGILNTETGSVSFEGTSAQIIPNSAFENNRIQNLQIDNPLGVTSQAIIEITGILKVEDGNLDTGNELTLISNENQTAFIDGSKNGEVIGLVSMQRYLDKAFGYKYFSSPFQNSVVGDFAPFMDFSDPESGFPHFYRYEENRRVDSLDLDATGWEPYTETSNNLNISEGYALNFGTSSASQTIELIGEVNNGEIPARQLENNHREYTKGFHLVGNPYPSPIDWNAANGWTRDNIDDGIYFFTASDDNQYTGTYTAFVNDISTGDSNVDGSSENIIPSMQGFFIKVSDSDTQDLITGSFGMDNRVRTNNFNQEFYRAQVTEQKSLLRLEAGFKGANRKDAMVIYFSSYATPNFEKEMDAHKLMNTDPAVPSFYNITTDKKELAINAIPFPESRSYKKIPLGIKADQNGQMQINLASIENLSPNFNVYLIDHVKSIGQNLNRDPEYTFNIKAGTHNSRFELMFSEEEVPSPAIAFNEPFDVKVENGNVVIELNLEESQQGVLRASTITGQILQIKEGRGKDQVIFDGITSDGVYIINLQVGKERHAKKVVIKK